MSRSDLNLTPTQFEIQVKEWLLRYARKLRAKGLHFVATGKTTLPGVDGDYEIDATATMEVIGGLEVRFLVECKHHKRKVSRELVSVLHDKLSSLGGHKGIMVSTSGFQAGAVEYSEVHGIALVHWQPSGMVRIAKGKDAPPEEEVGTPALVVPSGDSISYVYLENDSTRLDALLGLATS